MLKFLVTHAKPALQLGTSHLELFSSETLLGLQKGRPPRGGYRQDGMRGATRERERTTVAEDAHVRQMPGGLYATPGRWGIGASAGRS